MATEYITLIIAGVGIIGSLSGVVMGQRMSRSWQREQWVQDRRTEEFRELLDALANSLGVALTMHSEVHSQEEKVRELMNSHMNALRVIRSRIFVLEDVTAMGLELRWAEAGAYYQKTLDVEFISTVFNEARMAIWRYAGQSRNARRRPWYRRFSRNKLKVTKD